MLPPGHIAAGYLTAQALLHFSHPNLTFTQQNNLIFLGMLLGALPDIDQVYIALKIRSLRLVGKDVPSHRKFITHAPLIWLVAGLLIYFFASSDYVKYIGLLMWLGTWTHFLMDSFDYGVMWLWPLNTKIYSVWNKEVNVDVTGKNFFDYLQNFLKFYSKVFTFYLELLIIIVAILIHLR